MHSEPVRPFEAMDLKHLACNPDLQGIFRKVLEEQDGGSFAALATVPYGTSAWSQGAIALPLTSLEPGVQFAMHEPEAVVGIVIRGVFEIYEIEERAVQATESSKLSKGRPAKTRRRRKTTVVMEPGSLFGLFERYARWNGPWTIVSGVVSFFVCNPCGNEDRWRRRASRDHEVENLQIGTRSNCEFDSLIPAQARENWTAECVFFSPGLIKNHTLRLEAENLLKQEAINQLYSVINQNLTWSGVGGVHAPDNSSLFLEYIDSVVDRRTPMFQLLGHQDNSCLPVAALLNELNAYGAACDHQQCSWQIAVPRTLAPGAIGMFPADFVSRFPSTAYEGLFRKIPDAIKEQAARRGHAIALEKIGGVSWVRYRDDVLVHAYSVKTYEEKAGRGSKTLRSAMHPVALMQGAAQAPCHCSWNKHFNHVAVVRRVPPDGQ